MKTFLLTIIACVLMSLTTVAAEGNKSEAINLSGAEVQQVLEVYKKLAGLELVIDSRVRSMHAHVTVKVAAGTAKADALKAVEKALLEEARVVIAKLDDKRVSITMNDALPAPAGGHGH